jgi:hypothetical protein
VRGLIPVAAALALAQGCSPRPPDFSPDRAHTHVEQLGGTIGSRPIGSAANAAARAYLVEHLRGLGLATRVQSTVGSSAHGVSGAVHNVIASLDGERREAVALMAHYDSIPGGSGAVDDAFGTAVVLEAARALATRTARQWSLLVLLTDGEEYGLLGAEALVNDPEVRARVRVVLNLEAMGGDAPVLLFEASPDNGWLVDVWARRAPRPRGGSYSDEIYRRMPNDTDFSVFRRAGIPGLNFSAVGEAYSYHTSLEAPSRVTRAALADAGGAVVAIADALEREDITRRTPHGATYFDVLGVTAVSWPMWIDAPLALLALVAAVVAGVRTARALWGLDRSRGLVATAVWTVAGVALVSAATVGTIALLRAVREVYHPWYSRPSRFVIAMLLSGLSTGWLLARLGAHFRPGVLPLRHPAVVLLPTLIAWIALAAAAGAIVPRAAFLWVLPLLALAVPLAIAGVRAGAIWTGGVSALLVASVLWIRDAWSLVAFLVPLLGGLPLVTPVWVLPAVLLAAAAVVVPPALALIAASALPRPPFLTRALLVSTGFAIAWAYAAPAYTPERPLRMSIASVSGEPGGTIAMVSANEPVAPEGPDGLTLTPAPTPPRRLSRYLGGAPFVAIAPPQPARTVGLPGCNVSGNHVTVTLAGLEATRVVLELPAGLVPAASEPPGVVRGDVWSAAVAGSMASPVTFDLTLAADTDRACDGRLYAIRAAPQPSAEDGTAAVVWQSRLVDVLALR